MYIECNIEACWFNRCCSGKTVSIAYSECVFVAVDIQHAKHPAVQYFSTLFQKEHDFLKRGTEHKKIVFIFSTIFVSNVSFSKAN